MNNLANTYLALGRPAEGCELHEETLARRKARIGPDHPSTLMSMYNLAVSYHALGRYADALRLREQTLAFRALKLGPDHPETLRSMYVLAESLATLERSAEAVPVIDECFRRATGRVGCPPELLAGVAFLRLRHFEKSGNATGCRRTAEMWESLRRTDAAGLYNAARMRAVTAAVLRVADDSPAGREQSDADADRAMEWLKQAVAAGYRNAAHLKEDPDLDALRNRTDFTNLVTLAERTRD
jgi:hypothetical protein